MLFYVLIVGLLCAKDNEYYKLLEDNLDCSDQWDKCYGTKGEYKDTNHPPSRDMAVPYYTSTLPSKLFFFGGHDFYTLDYNDFWDYDVRLEMFRWIHGPKEPNSDEVCVGNLVYDITNLPRARLNAGSAVTLSNTFLLVGGANVASWHAYLDIWEFDPKRGQFGEWQRLRETSDGAQVIGNPMHFDSANHPYRAFDARFHQIGSDAVYITVLGGIAEEQYMSQIWEYSYIENAWAFFKGNQELNDFEGKYNPEKQGCTAANYPSARSLQTTWLHNNKLYMFGGVYFKGEWTQEDIPVLYWKSDMWEYSLDSMLWCWIAGQSEENRDEHIAVEFGYSEENIPSRMAPSQGFVDDDNNLLFLFSGVGVYNPPNVGSNEVWVYRIETKEWKMTNGTRSNQEVEKGVISQRAGTTIWRPNKGEVYIFGGIRMEDMENLPTFNDLWEYTKTEYFCDGKDRDDVTVCNGRGMCEATTTCECDRGFSGTYCETKGDTASSWQVIVATVVPVTFVAVLIVCCVVIVFAVLVALSYTRRASKIGGGEKISVNQGVEDYGTTTDQAVILEKDKKTDTPVKKEQEKEADGEEDKGKKTILFKKKKIEKE